MNQESQTGPSLEIVGSDSGLLDLTREYEDTGLVAELVAPESLEGVRSLIKERSAEIFAQAVEHRFRASPETHVIVPVHYMGTGDIKVAGSGIWEAGLVPKQVDYDGSEVSTNGMLLYRAISSRVRGPDQCILQNGVWKRWPD